MASHCRDAAEGWKFTSQLRNFDMTLCFEEGIIFTSLLVILLVSATFRLWLLTRLPSRDVSFKSHWRLWTKLTLLGLALLTSLSVLFFVFTDRIRTAVVWHYALEPLALFAALLLTRLNHLRTRSSSTILLLFWPTYTAAVAIWTRSYTEAWGGLPLVPLKCAILFLGLCSFALECISPDDSADSNSENPTITANVFSIWSFAWLTPLLKQGSQVIITEDDLPVLVPRDESANLENDLQRALEKHSGLWTALFVAYGHPYMGAACLRIVQDTLTFVQPQLLRWLLAYITEYQSKKGAELVEGTSPLQGYTIAIAMFVASIAQTIALHQCLQVCSETGRRIRAGLVTAIYKKSLVLSSDERGRRASGDIVNLMAVDASRIQDLCMHGIITISGPFQITLAFVSLYDLLGWSAFVGVAIMIFSIPLNTFIARILKKMQEKQMKNRDRRTRLIGELLANIKSIKLYAWEYAFIRRVLHVRNDLELKMLRKIGIVTALNTTLWSAIPLIVAFCSFATASVFSLRPLTADVIFPAISLFMLLQFPLSMFSQATSNIIEALVSVKRLSDFLHAEELQQDVITRIEKRSLSINDEVLSIKDGEFQWTKNGIPPALEDINLTVRKGELLGVLGRVGAGKSSLLSAIIGDMKKTEGEVVLSGRVAYAAQNPWILSATVRDNILFSHEYDEVFYNMVIEACALKPDLAVLPHSDLTEVGEKGITLSGGQRARVALARAVYARADLVLLDDVLAAVDSHVARHIFESVIGPQGLLANKARILVTNNIVYLKYFDRLTYLRHGIILECGTYCQLVSNPDSEVRKLVQNHATSGVMTPAPFGSTGVATPFTSEGDIQSKLLADMDSVTEKVVRRESFCKAVIAAPPPLRQAPTSGLSEEHSEQGRVKKEVYYQYLQAASKTGFFFFILVTVSQQAVTVLATLMLRVWGERNREAGSNTGLKDPYLLGYGFFNLMSIVLGGTGALLIWLCCSLRSSKYLHHAMLDSVMRAPLSFFEMTPTGRILNLFSRDTYVMDQILGRVIQNLIRACTVCASIVLVIGLSFPPFLIAVVPLTWFYARVTAYYLYTSRELKRLDAVSKSPILSWFSESLTGLSTIRAYNQQSIFIANNAQRIDRNQMCSLPSSAINRWLAIRLEFLGSVIILFTAVLSVAAIVTSDVDAGLVGLVLSYALNTTGSLNWFVRSASEVEQNVVSVERIIHYAKDLPSEAPYELSDHKPPGGWPSGGEVEFHEYSTRYRPELDLVLKDISLTIKPKEKVGIVGRTGAGKSSLLLALFRIIEPTSGKILIDGIDIGSIGLHDLRSAISIVPQSPDMFKGTLRENIDPVGEHQDADIWAALENANLKAYVESLPEGLDTPVQEGGSSLSSGQRQLLCFARALLRKSKVLVLDEATSAVDLDTDCAIQEIIKGPIFHDVTILTIAHRLNTIIESDRVVVLEQGRVAESEAPEVLLADKTSRFYSMALEAGLVQDTGREDGGVTMVEVERGGAAGSGGGTGVVPVQRKTRVIK
ncbi:hypothetical protein PAXINDRAFT_106999 [Paxillus involutus ATCC 200175]|nr:hypothetical protein PAXINDRAFT_106999 [Paxillus involutus ATCC 200175]